MEKHVKLFEEWQLMRPALGFIASKSLGTHIRQATDSHDNNVKLSVVELTEQSNKIVLDLAKETYPEEFKKLQHFAEYIILFKGDIPNNQQELKSRELQFEIDGLCKTRNSVYGRIKGFSFVAFTPSILILSDSNNDVLTTSLNFKNINAIKLTGYLKTFKK